MLSLAAFALPGRGQGSGILLAYPDFLNKVCLGTPTGGLQQAPAVAFFGGNIGSAPTAPTDGARFLAQCAFGQMVAGMVRRPPDVQYGGFLTVGQSGLIPAEADPTKAPTVDPPSAAFYLADQSRIYFNDSGFVTVTWKDNGGGDLPPVTLLVSSVAAPTEETFRIYWTLTNGVPTLAPAVDLAAGPDAIVHPSISLGTNSLWVDGTWLKAQQQSGPAVLEYRSRTDGSFLGTAVVDVRPYFPDHNLSVDVGVILESETAVASARAARPRVTRGLNDDPPYVYQVISLGPPTDGQVLATRPTPDDQRIEVFWMKRDGFGVVWPFEMDRYTAFWPANFEAVTRRAYVNYDAMGSVTKAPFVDLPPSGVNVRIHYNPEITWPQTAMEPATRKLVVSNQTGRVLVQFDQFPQTNLFALQFVDVRSYYPDDVDAWDIGFELQPNTTPPDADLPFVARGGPPGTEYVYQHNVDGPMKGTVFAVRRTTTDDQIEVFWMRRGVLNVIWPYEMHRYAADWPAAEPAKYQLYVRAPWPVLGPGVDIPAVYAATLMPFQEPAGHAGPVLNHTFSSSNPGWSLLKYAPSNIVMFQVVRSVLHDDAVFFNLTSAAWDIGVEITDPYHAGPRPGYIHLPEGDRYDWEIYDGKSGDPPEFRTAQIFAVNVGLLEVWWYNLNREVQWPSLVKRYDADWPAVGMHKIIIASTRGTEPLDPAVHRDFGFYHQNDPLLPGFNPNDEHALRQQLDNGEAIFALRDDLGTPATSDPWVLVKWRDNLDRWHYRPYRVLSEESPHLFRYGGEAGALIQPPFPLSTLPRCEESHGVSGPFWRDRNLDHWAKAAGDNGGPAGIVMRFFYAVQEGFYFPGPTPPALGDHVPWLDVRAGTPGTPINITYTVTWPALLPELKVGETLVKAKFGLPEIADQVSTEVLYDQSAVLGQGQSAKVIDPTRIRQVALAQLPPDVRTASRSGKTYFTDLPPHLRSRLWHEGEPVNQLRFKGEFVETLGIEEPQGYLLLNVITDRDKAEMLALSQDAAFRSAVNQLAGAASSVIEVPPNQPFDRPLALTAGLAKSGGYVTLAFNNNTNPVPTGPVSVNLIKVVCPIYRGELKVLLSENPFDEKVTLRHSGDFAGKADDYTFEWRTLPPGLDGLPQTSKPPQEWFAYNPTPADGHGAQDITISGPGLFTLSDNYFICRYKPATPGHACGSDTWSVWTEPQLAEGWIKRVLAGIDPFEQRIRDYQNYEVNTIVSMISQAGARWAGDVPLNQEAANELGLIEIYETVLKRGIELSIGGLPPVNYPPANDALLLAAGRISDLYMLLGNEAYADAADPTIAFGTDDGQYGSEASSIHCFQNQTASLLEEELKLLRGRDDSLLPSTRVYPFYNKMMWNFTRGINGGEVAYSLNYGIEDVTGEGTIDENDARRMYPQGHGDAWGHYLTALKGYYRLLRNPNFTWVPRIEAVLVSGVPVSVDYYDERKFAQAAAARARTGAEIVNQTYRHGYTEDPDGQWQGYQDPLTNRAWGMAEWGSRAGQGALFDWLTANALLPALSTNTGIQKVDRTTVTELRDIAAAFQDVQEQVDKADVGVNPLGLARNVVPFDISPTEIDAGKTHFEQIYDRAVKAMNNAITVFNHANNSTQILRRQADNITEFQQTVGDREADFNNRLIEIFGYPFPEDIGAGKTYATGYDGPDLYHYAYLDSSQWAEQVHVTSRSIPVLFTEVGVNEDGSVTEMLRTVTFNVAEKAMQFIKPSHWTVRRAPGEIQRTLADLVQLRLRLEKALVDYDNLLNQIESQADLLEAVYGLHAEEINVLNQSQNTQRSLNDQIRDSRNAELGYRTGAKAAVVLQEAVAEFFPKTFGLATDVTAPARGALRLAGAVISGSLNLLADAEGLHQLDYQFQKEMAQADTNLRLTTLRQEQALLQQIAQIEQLARQEASMRLEIYNLIEAIQQGAGNHRAALARGQRLLEDRLRFRQQTAAQVQAYRYKDMAFRVFRNDALQKYRAQFDLAAMYVFLCAKAYDFETNLREGDPRHPASEFVDNIVRARTLGLIQNGQPMTGAGSGDAGLADAMARMWLNWDLVLRSQLGFNNPDTETGRFSLRQELFRVQTNLTSRAANAVWREVLSRSVVSNLFDIPEFQRYCIPFSPSLPQEPGIVIRFRSTINFGENFFGWPAGGGDNSYDSSHFATKARSVGVWFANYNNLGGGMINTPRVYLVPVGSDVLRSPTGNMGITREWRIMDQLLPVPFPLSPADLADPGWIPLNDSMSGILGDIRKYPSFRAYHDSGSFDPAETISNSRLIGRSLWNTEWLLIIPAGTLHSDRTEGLERFIHGALVGGVRDGNGVTDIKLFFQSYSYAGN
ncbi:MAG: hypothetical protein JXQ71_02255 [Verrucomicrobia bacterium]|nr:hypothetical protein [Verrucomicrobiota bacterium]